MPACSVFTTQRNMYPLLHINQSSNTQDCPFIFSHSFLVRVATSTNDEIICAISWYVIYWSQHVANRVCCVSYIPSRNAAATTEICLMLECEKKEENAEDTSDTATNHFSVRFFFFFTFFFSSYFLVLFRNDSSGFVIVGGGFSLFAYSFSFEFNSKRIAWKFHIEMRSICTRCMPVENLAFHCGNGL